MGKAGVFHRPTEHTHWGVVKGKNSRWHISEVGMQEGKLMELERFQLIPSQHLFSYFKGSKFPHIRPIQSEASVLKYTLSQIEETLLLSMVLDCPVPATSLEGKSER